ncbi:8244_t:CDS:1, partial [Cetraspora pellucida]
MDVCQLYSGDRSQTQGGMSPIEIYVNAVDNGAVEAESHNQPSTSQTSNDLFLSLQTNPRLQEQQRLLLQRIQHAMNNNESFYSSSSSTYSSSVLSLISSYNYDQANNSKETTLTNDPFDGAKDLPPLPKPSFS